MDELENRNFLMRSPNGDPHLLLKWPARGFDISIWSQSRETWVAGWRNIMDEVHDLTREADTKPVSVEEAEELKPLVTDPSDETVAAWAQSSREP